MGVVFAVRGNAGYSARFAPGGGTAFAFNPSQISTTAGGLSGTLIDLTAAVPAKFLSWPGYKNTPNGRVMSVLMRGNVNYSGTPGAHQAYWSIATGHASASNIFAFYEFRHLTSGSLTVLGKNESGATTVNHGAAWSPTSGTLYDLFYRTTGTTDANSSQIYVDASLLSQSTPAAAYSSSWNDTYWHDITAGATPNVAACNFLLDELVIWDELIDPTSVALVGGSGSLNGASRTALVDISAFGGPQTYSRGRVVNG